MRDWYVESFKDIRSFPNIKHAEDEAQFNALLEKIYARHTDVVPMVALGVAHLKRELATAAPSVHLNDMPEIHQFLDTFYMSRIGIRMLIGQHNALHQPQKANHIGLICAKVSPVEIAREVRERSAWRPPAAASAAPFFPTACERASARIPESQPSSSSSSSSSRTRKLARPWRTPARCACGSTARPPRWRSSATPSSASPT